MEFIVKQADLKKTETDCLLLGVSETGELLPSLEHENIKSDSLKKWTNLAKATGKLGQIQFFYPVSIPAQQVAGFGLGKLEELTEVEYKKALCSAFTFLKHTQFTEVACLVQPIPVIGRDLYWKIRFAIEAISEAFYEVGTLKTKEKEKITLDQVVFWVTTHEELEIGKRAIKDAQAIVTGVETAKQLANSPGNICTPTYMAQKAESLTKTYPALKATVLEQKQIEALKMGAFLSVTRGSEEPPKFIILEYHGTPKKQKPIVLIGKGITFDSGGISIKPSEHMDEMKFDMSGAAAVLGTLSAVAQLQLPLQMIGLIPCCENLPDGRATKPGDIITSMSGQTIEVLNTDAEGRLILCDALTYSERYHPEVVIDIATLTGACVVALGQHASGLFTSDEQLAEDLLNAGHQSHDKTWRLPLWEVYQEQIDSNFADMTNTGGREGGSITAACFLWRFAKKLRWAHIDIAGVAWKRDKEKSATGKPVSLLLQYLMNHCGK